MDQRSGKELQASELGPIVIKFEIWYAEAESY
jgi:hypothetical protein